MPLPTAYGTVPIGGALPEAYIDPFIPISTTDGANNLPTGYGVLIPAVSMTAAASGSSGITVADDDDIDFGTGNFTIHWEGSCNLASAAIIRLSYKFDGANGYTFNINGSGAGNFVTVSLNGGTVSALSTVAPKTLYASNQNLKITASITRENASVAGAIVFYINGAQLGDPFVIPAGSPASINNATPLYILGDSSIRYASTTRAFYLYNRALSAAEVLSLSNNGVAAADEGASQTELLTNGDFETWSSSTNPGTWTEGSNVSASVSQVTGADAYAGTYSLQFTGAGLPSSSIDNTVHQTVFSTNDLGRVVRISIAARRISGAGSLYVGQGQGEFSTISTATGLDGTWKIFTIEKTLTDLSTGSARRIQVAGASGSVFQVDAYSIKFIGNTLALAPTGLAASGLTWTDSSGNGNDGTLPAAGATKVTIRK